MPKTGGYKYDLAVAYRIYPGISKTPLVYADDKYQLARLCLRSFKQCLGDLKVKMLVILDGCPPEYKQLFTELFNEVDLVFHVYDGIGNQATFNEQIDWLLQQEDTETVYLAEDDYFYLPGQFPAMIDFLNSGHDVDFITPYDHPDYYSRPFHRPPAMTREYGRRRWRTAQSTCLTFLTTKASLQLTAGLFRSFARGNHDHALWAALTKFSGMRIWDHAATAFKEIYYLKLLYLTWRYGGRQISCGKKWRLWAPTPAIATHIESSGIAPTVDWMVEISKQEKEKT
ncbi:MAG TPA: glycosyltransferase family 2 protein [bacterium]|nr:glycosyltransferase family 2 protein [bacterium]HPN45225.1 glycosyltransferase family 2 protein [bacterium]